MHLYYALGLRMGGSAVAVPSAVLHVRAAGRTAIKAQAAGQTALKVAAAGRTALRVTGQGRG